MEHEFILINEVMLHERAYKLATAGWFIGKEQDPILLCLCWYKNGMSAVLFMLARRVMAQTGITRAYNRFRAISDL